MTFRPGAFRSLSSVSRCEILVTDISYLDPLDKDRKASGRNVVILLIFK